MEKILIVVDMQNDFIDGVLGTPEAKTIVPKVVQKIKDWDGYYILYTTDSHFFPFYNFSVEGQAVPLHCELNTKGWEVKNEVWEALKTFHFNPLNYIEGIEKDTFIGFEIEKYIDEQVQPENPFEIHLIGLCTDICVISNALFLRSLYPYAQIIVDAQCCAGTTPEQHQAALNVMKACCIEVINEN